MFFLGIHLNGSALMKDPGEENFNESRSHDDILQFSIKESYLNNTLKVFSLYEWLIKNCESSLFVLKVDDDTYMNLDLFWKEIAKLPKVSKELFIQYGYPEGPFRIKDNRRMQQYIPYEISPIRYFHFQYVWGFAALTPMVLVKAVFAVGVCLRGLFVDDVYIGGYLPFIVGANVGHLRSVYPFSFRKHVKYVYWNNISSYSIVPDLTPDNIEVLYKEHLKSKPNMKITFPEKNESGFHI